uniref:Uncharacterized protein n=1 Tax=Ditylenchus dipsaci TaxID=166011 RepID=A0A915CUZ5_9BILA
MMLCGFFIVFSVSFASVCQCAKSSKATNTASDTTESSSSSNTIASQTSSSFVTFPTPTITTTVSATLNITSDRDFNFTRFTAAPSVGSSTENEEDYPILYLANGVTIKNSNFGADLAYWANTVNKYTIQRGGVQNAGDKLFIQQGAGTTYITDFFAKDVS